MCAQYPISGSTRSCACAPDAARPLSVYSGGDQYAFALAGECLNLSVMVPAEVLAAMPARPYCSWAALLGDTIFILLGTGRILPFGRCRFSDLADIFRICGSPKSPAMAAPTSRCPQPVEDVFPNKLNGSPTSPARAMRISGSPSRFRITQACRTPGKTSRQPARQRRTMHT